MSNTKADTSHAELVKLKNAHSEAMFKHVIIAIVVICGIVCVVRKIEGGQFIVGSVVGHVTNWVGEKKSGNRSARW